MNVPLSYCLEWIQHSIDWYERGIERGLRQGNLSKAQNALAAREACERIKRDFTEDFHRYQRLNSPQRPRRRRK